MNLTYGFELEGFFKRETLMTRYPDGDWKNDGSVRINASEMDAVGWSSISLKSATEFESRVYTSPEELVKDLAKFEYKKHHLWNYSCGLHLNIGADDWKALFRLAINWQLMAQIRKAALGFCEHQKYRLEHPTQYYDWFGSRDNLIRQISSSKKYSFCNFHPEHRLEFRFLCPCEHKVKNVQTTLAILLRWLDSSGSKKYRISNKTEKLEKTITKTIKLGEPSKSERLEYVLRSSSQDYR